MADSAVCLFELTDEQRKVAEAPPDARQIVLAQAGSGKTHVLINRVEYLIAQGGLAGGDELILLTFSRAVVRELKSRASASGGEARFATISTFDSFATRLLAQELPESAWIHLSYDDRINLAVRQLRDPSTPCEAASMCRHLLVDEIQDVIGVRAELILSILARTDCGFTLFGDLAQSIYGFQGPGLTPDELLGEIRSAFPDQVRTRTLTTGFRAKSPIAESALDFGMRLLDRTQDPAALAFDLRTFELGLPTFSSLHEMERLMRPDCPSIALLTRTNGEALLVSQELHRLGIQHELPPKSESRPAAGWIAEALSEIDATTIPISRAAGLIQQFAGDRDSDELATALFRLARSGKDIDLRRLSQIIRSGSVPGELEPSSDMPVTVSTIHRAKGLEFERVALVGDMEWADRDAAEECRIRYVALTRAREDLYTVEIPTSQEGRLTKKAGRWCIIRYRSGWSSVTHLEIDGSDACAGYLQGIAEGPQQVHQVQSYISRSVSRGDPVSLERLRGDVPVFWIVHDGTRVGRTGPGLEIAVGRVLGKRAGQVLTIEGLRVEIVDTVAGDPAIGRQAKLGSNGLWQRVRICGFGELKFERKSPHA